MSKGMSCFATKEAYWESRALEAEAKYARASKVATDLAYLCCEQVGWLQQQGKLALECLEVIDSDDYSPPEPKECDSCKGSGSQLVSDDPQPAYVGCSDCHGTGLKDHGADCECCPSQSSAACDLTKGDKS